jgi:hypothetical protein
MGSGAMKYVPSFMKIGSGIQKFIEGGYADTHTHARAHAHTQRDSNVIP